MIQITMFHNTINLPIDPKAAKSVMYKDPKKIDKRGISTSRGFKPQSAITEVSENPTEDFPENTESTEEKKDDVVNDEVINESKMDEETKEDRDYTKFPVLTETRSKEGKTHDDDDLVIIPLNYMRVFYFLVTNTKTQYLFLNEIK